MYAMQVVLNDVETESPILIRPRREMSNEEFFDFCLANPKLRTAPSGRRTLLGFYGHAGPG